MDPKKAVVVGDAKSEASQKAREIVIGLQKEAEKVLKALEDDPQADVRAMVPEYGIAELRDATNTINDLMEDRTAAAIQRLQRLMIQAKYRWEDELPFPENKKGVKQPRGATRLERILEALREYIDKSNQLLKFI